jgi:hypothetical protein
VPAKALATPHLHGAALEDQLAEHSRLLVDTDVNVDLTLLVKPVDREKRLGATEAPKIV